MEIKKYDSYFHDGSLIDIQTHDDNIEISMDSSELPLDEVEANLFLTNYGTLKGKLHLEKIKLMKENGILVQTIDKGLNQIGDISHFKLSVNKLKLLVIWQVFTTGYPKTTGVSEYEIECENIWWESLPKLFDPFNPELDVFLEALLGGIIYKIAMSERYEGRLEIIVESLPISKNQNVQRVCHADNETLKGRLICDWMEWVWKDGSFCDVQNIEHIFDQGEILECSIQDHTLFLKVKWKTVPSKNLEGKVEVIKIKAGVIDWCYY